MKKILFALCALLSWKASAFDGVVLKQDFLLPSYQTTSGPVLHQVHVGYETYGSLNADKTNVILITHYFSGNSHAAGKYAAVDAAPGYWDSIIGPGKAFDTNKYFIVSSDNLVNVNPKNPHVITTGPMSLDPETNKTYGMKFPKLTLLDFVQVQKALLNSLGIKKLIAVAGASSGAALSMQWGVTYPEFVSHVVASACPLIRSPCLICGRSPYAMIPSGIMGIMAQKNRKRAWLVRCSS
jgi:homoserine O-acetyltransferase